MGKKEILKVKEHCEWYLLDDSKPNELIYLVTLFGVSRSKYVAHQFVTNHRELLVRGRADKKENRILPVEVTVPVPVPEAFDFKHAKGFDLNDQNFTIDWDVDDFLVSDNFSMILG
nr:hypothetical protein [Tanacetum cinerariifolium]